jgi:hypothetical protein
MAMSRYFPVSTKKAMSYSPPIISLKEYNARLKEKELQRVNQHYLMSTHGKRTLANRIADIDYDLCQERINKVKKAQNDYRQKSRQSIHRKNRELEPTMSQSSTVFTSHVKAVLTGITDSNKPWWVKCPSFSLPLDESPSQERRPLIIPQIVECSTDTLSQKLPTIMDVTFTSSSPLTTDDREVSDESSNTPEYMGVRNTKCPVCQESFLFIFHHCLNGSLSNNGTESSNYSSSPRTELRKYLFVCDDCNMCVHIPCLETQPFNCHCNEVVDSSSQVLFE